MKPLLIIWFVFIFFAVAVTFLCEHYFLWVAFICTYHNTDTEHCKNVTLQHGSSQKITNLVDNIGTWSINGLTGALLITIHIWDRYSTINFIKTVIKVEQFWIFTGLFIFVSVPLISIDDFEQAEFSVIILGMAILMEYATSALLALTIFFIDWNVVKRWLLRMFQTKCAQILARCYIKFVLLVYLLRSLYLFLYNIYCISIHISHVESHQLKYLDFVLQVMNVAYRGSLTKMFYCSFFKDMQPPEVCKDEEIIEDEDQLAFDSPNQSTCCGLLNVFCSCRISYVHIADGERQS